MDDTKNPDSASLQEGQKGPAAPKGPGRAERARAQFVHEIRNALPGIGLALEARQDVASLALLLRIEQATDALDDAMSGRDQKNACPGCGGHGWPTAHDSCEVCHGDPLPSDKPAAGPSNPPAVLKDTQAPPQEDTDNTGRAATRRAPDAGVCPDCGSPGPPCEERPRTAASAGPDLVGLLRRIRQWDHLDSAADGPYWKREIDALLTSEQPTAGPSPSIPASPVPAPSGSAEERAKDIHGRAYAMPDSTAYYFVLHHIRSAESSAYALGRKELEFVLRAAPHALLCASSTITEGSFPTARGDPPQMIRPRQPPDESLCDCWKARALAGTGAQPPGDT